MEMGRFLFFVTVIYGMLGSSFPAEAQYDHVWALGIHAGIDFNQSPPAAIYTGISSGDEASSAICDVQGQLLFYTDGDTLWNRYHQVMPSGTNLSGLGQNITTSTSQGTLIVPMPGHTQKYYVFSLGSWETLLGRLSYSIVDMSLDNGRGDVEPGSKGTLLTDTDMEQMIAVSGDDCNIWLIATNRSPKVFKAFNIGFKGMDTIPVVSERITRDVWPNYSSLGTMQISPDRKKLALANDGNLGLYNFNASSGQLTNIGILASPGSYAVEFSPDNTKLYWLTDSLYQVDVSSNDISKILMSREGIAVPARGAMALKRAPDGKIYGSETFSNTLSIIQEPNVAGKACNYVPKGFKLADGTHGLLGLPNTPVLAIKQNYNSIADTIPCADNYLLKPLMPNGRNHRWNDGTQGASHLIDTSGTFWVHYQVTTTSCEAYTDTFHVDFHRISRRHTTTDYSGGCASDTFTMRAKVDADHYTWEDGSIGRVRRINRSGIYWVNYTVDSMCYVYTDTFRVSYPQHQPSVSFIVDSLVCVGDQVDFQNTADSRFNQFYWSLKEQFLDTMINTKHVFDQAGVYSVRLLAKIDGKCQDSATANIIVDAVYPFSMQVDRNMICTGESLLFRVNTNYTTTGLFWQFDAQNARLENNGALFNHAYEQAGLFPLQVTALNRACPNIELYDTIRVNPLPAVDLGVDRNLCLGGTPIVLENVLENPLITCRNLWNTGDTTASLKVSVPGTYSLTVQTVPEGCVHTATIEMRKDCYLDIPNAFSPNGDGYNDYFFPRQLVTKSLQRFTMKIVNRWGQTLFETSNAEGRGWDGLCNGRNQPEGVYIYLIEAELAHGQREQYKGNVTLVR